MIEKERTDFGNPLVGQAYTSWSEVRSQTLALLGLLEEDMLTIEFPRPVFNTFGKQFQELGVVQNAFTIAIKTGNVDFSDMDVEFDPTLITSKDKIRGFLTKHDESLHEVLREEKEPSRLINWGLPRNPTLLEHIYWLSQHETLHHGQLIAYCYLLNLDFPESWATSMALPPREPDIVFSWLKEWNRHVRKP